MFKNFNRATTTTIIGVLIIVLSFGFFYLSGLGMSKASESSQTQINQGLFGLVMLVAGYYFGSSTRENNNNNNNNKN